MTTQHKMTLREIFVEFPTGDCEVKGLALEVDKVKTARSAHLLGFAKECKDTETFLAACKDAEEWAMSKEGIDLVKAQLAKIDKEAANNYRLDKLPRSWINAKSVIKRGLNAHADDKLNIDDYNSEKLLRERLVAIKASDDGTTPRPKGAAKTPDVTVSEDVRRAMSAVMFKLHTLEKEGEQGTVKVLQFIRKIDSELDAFMKEVLPEAPIPATTKGTGTQG